MAKQTLKWLMNYCKKNLVDSFIVLLLEMK